MWGGIYRINMRLVGSNNSKLVSWQLYEYYSGVYVVKVEDSYERAMLFLRYQEYYESPYGSYYNKSFSILDFMNSYRKFSNSGSFIYPEEWSGFNIPGGVLLKCIAGVKDKNGYDIEMKKISKLISKEVGKKKFYLMGVNSLDGAVIEHELAHAFYYLDKKYRHGVNSLIDGLSSDKVYKMEELLISWGYRKKVLRDEVQAYLSTGLSKEQAKIFSRRDCREFIQHFKSHKCRS